MIKLKKKRMKLNSKYNIRKKEQINLKIKMKKIRLKEIKGLCKTPKTISYRRKIS